LTAHESFAILNWIVTDIYDSEMQRDANRQRFREFQLRPVNLPEDVTKFQGAVRGISCTIKKCYDSVAPGICPAVVILLKDLGDARKNVNKVGIKLQWS